MYTSIYTDDSAIQDSSAPSSQTNTDEHNSLITLLGVAQQYRVDLLPVTWQQFLPSLGEGASGVVHQSSVLKDFSLAFKDFSAPAASEGIDFGAMMREIMILQSPAIQKSQNVIDLNGICWKFDKGLFGISPILVYSVGQCGNLKDFVDDKLASFKTNELIMIQLARGFIRLHESGTDFDLAIHLSRLQIRAGVVHGDIKPENVFVYASHGNSNLTLAKIADVSFSHIKRAENTRIHLPKSEPWVAPEWHHREHTIEQAQAMDVFSFGLLCFWILFRNHLFDGLTYEEEMDHLDKLKCEDKLIGTASTLLETLSENATGYSDLHFFFSGVLANDPRNRIQLISADMPYLGQFTDGVIEESTIYSQSDHPNFRLATSIDQWYQMEFRVRQNLVRILDSATRDKCYQCARNAALQTAMCFYIAFGTTRDVERANRYLSQHDIDISEMILELDLIRGCQFSERPGQAKWYLEPDLINQYQESGNLAEAIKYHWEETLALEDCFDAAHPLVRMSKSTLVHLLDGYGRTKEALDLCKQQLDGIEGIFEDDHEAMVSTKSQMALLECKMGNSSRGISIGEDLLSICERSAKDVDRLTMTVLSNLVVAYSKHGDHKKASTTSERLRVQHDTHLGPNHPETLINLQHLAISYTEQFPRRFPEALALQEETLKKWRLNFGQTHRYTIEAMMMYANILKRSEERVESVAEKNDTALELKKWAMEASMDQLLHHNPTTWVAMANYAQSLLAYGKLEEASVLLCQSVENLERLLPCDHHDVLDVKLLLADACARSDNESKAQSLVEEILATYSSANSGTDNVPQALVTELRAWYSYGHRCQSSHDNSAAQQAWERALEIAKMHEGFNHSVARKTASHLGPLYIAEGRHEAGITLLTELVKWCEEHLGNEHYERIKAKQELGANLIEVGKFREARDTLQEVLPQTVAAFGDDNEETLLVQGSIALAMRRLGDIDAARLMSEDVLAKRRVTLGDAHEDTILSMRNLLHIYVELLLWPEAQNLIKEISLAIELSPLNDNDFQVFQSLIAGVYTGSGRLEEGEKRFRLEVAKYPHSETPQIGLITAQYSLAWVLSDTENLADAADMARRSLEGREVLFGSHSWPVCRSYQLLGVILREQGELEEAEQAFERELEVSRHMKDGLDHTDIVEAWELLITVYKKQDRSESIAHAQQEIEALKGM
jgi:tetratricopeptide (TPR) repeat protein